MSDALFIGSIAAYVAGAAIYARAALADAPALRRLCFIATLFIVIAIAASVEDDHPWIDFAFPVYVAATVYGWFSSASDAQKRGAQATGIARAIWR